MWPVLVAFKVNWLLAVNYNQQAGLAMLGIFGLMLVLSWRRFSHWTVFYCLGLAGLGCAIDLGLLHFNLIGFNQDSLPLLMLLLWASFSLVLPMFKQLLGAYFIPVMAITGPASYYFASYLGVLQFQQASGLVLAVMALAWLGFAWSAKAILEESYA